jgi:hypothetical protein
LGIWLGRPRAAFGARRTLAALQGRAHGGRSLPELLVYIVEARRGAARFSDHHDIHGAREQLTVLPEYLAHQAFHPVATHGTADLLRNRQSQPLAFAFAAPQNDDEATRVNTTTFVAHTAKLEPLTQAVCGP